MKPLVLLVLGLLASAQSWSEPLASKDWMTNQAVDEVFTKDSCLAATNVSKGSNRSQLLLSFSKDSANVPQLLLKVWDVATPEQRLTVKISSKVSYPLFLWKASAKADEPSIYWYAPIGWQPLMDYIASASTLNIQGSTTKLSLSLRGSSVALDRTAKCLNAGEILPLDFLKKLNSKIQTSASIYNSVNEMIAGNEKSFEAYRVGSAKAVELANLRKNMTVIVDQETKATDKKNTTQGALLASEKSLATSITQLAGYEKVLAEANVALPIAQNEIIPLKQALEIKAIPYRPAYDKFYPFAVRYQNAQEALTANNDKTKPLQNRIADIEKTLPSMQSDYNGYPRRIATLESRLSSQKNDYEDAKDKADINVSSELDSRLRSDFQYQNYHRDEEKYTRDAQNLRSRESGALANLRTAEDRVSACKGTPNPNCAALEATVQERKALLNEIQRGISDAERQASSAQSSADDIYRRTLSSIENDKNNWQRKADSLRSAYRQTEQELSSLQISYRDLEGRIADLKDERDRLSGQVQSLLAQRPSLQQELNIADQSLEEARVRLDYDRLRDEYLTAKKPVDLAQTRIDDLTAKIRWTAVDIENSKKQISSLQAKILTQTQERDQAQAQLTAIQDSLQPLRAQESALGQEITQLAADFEEGKARYQQTYGAWTTAAVDGLAVSAF